MKINYPRFFSWPKILLPLLLYVWGVGSVVADEHEEEIDASEVLLRGDNYFFGFYSSQITTDKNRLMNFDNSASSGSGIALFLGRDLSERLSSRLKFASNSMSDVSEYGQNALGLDFILHISDTRTLITPYVSGGVALNSNDYNLEDRFTGTTEAGGTVSGSSTNLGISNGYGILIDPAVSWLLDGRLRFRTEFVLDFDFNDAVPQGTSYFYDQYLNIGAEYVFSDFASLDVMTTKTLQERLEEEEAIKAEEEAEEARLEAEEEERRQEEEEQARIRSEQELFNRQQQQQQQLGLPGVTGTPLGSYSGSIAGLSEFAILGDVRNKRVIYFGESSSYFNTIQRIKLLDLVEILKQNPFYRVEIIGHSEANYQIIDPDTRARFNREISARRALRIYNFLVRQGIVENRILPRWRADADLLNGSQTGIERAVNRRAVINLVLEQPN